MARRFKIEIAELRRFVEYAPDTGLFRWAADVPGAPSWYARAAGQPAFCTPCPDGYLTGVFRKTYLRAHHVAYALVEGRWLDQPMDHINGVRSDNRWVNIRPATVTQNNRNRAPRVGKRFVGTTWNAQQKEWRANIQIRGKKVFLGAFPTEEAAAEAFDRAALARSPEFIRLNFPERREEYASDTRPVGRGRNSGLLAA